MIKSHRISDVMGQDPMALACKGLIVFPFDLRSLHCRLCDDGNNSKVIMGQDRVAMAAHLMNRHNLNLPKAVLKYKCRVCGAEFNNTGEMRAVDRHQCSSQVASAATWSTKSGNDFSEDSLQPTPFLLPLSSSSRPKESAAAQKEQIDEYNAAEPCLYCDRPLAPTSKASHRAKHWDLDFQCSKCTRAFSLFNDIKQHLKDDHELSLETDEGVAVSAKELADRGWLIMPKDLRTLDCTVCQKAFLCQDRLLVVSHMKRSHNGQVVSDKNDLFYGCRSCGRSDFKTSAEVFRHPCFRNASNGYARTACINSPAADEGIDGQADEPLLDLSEIEWKGDTYIMGDLRRLACRLCGIQINGKLFFKMVKHLETEHDKFQESRLYQLDTFVKFGCITCSRFQPQSVHLWDKHFLNETCTRCEGMGVIIEDELKLPDPVPPQINEEGGDSGCPDEPSDRDIRKLECTLCSSTFEKCGYDTLQNHLRTKHTKDTIRSPILDSFAKFGCLKCTNFQPESSGVWKKHFHRGNTVCRDSYEASLLSTVVHLDDESTGARELKCKICNFSANGKDVIVICKHLESDHGIDTRPPSDRFETHVEFGCMHCPGFHPKDARRWDRHFSRDFNQCQGSSRIERSQSGRTRALFWCDSCRETREDIERHFLGPAHEAGIDALRAKEKTVVDCDVCFVGFSTEQNFNLHKEGAHHVKMLAKSRNATQAAEEI